ncbi:MAG: hypothetical protein IKB73_05370 [Ruminococcus sp.]|nr:hypothetical protein [Ruminococcus sp.]
MAKRVTISILSVFIVLGASALLFFNLRGDNDTATVMNVSPDLSDSETVCEIIIDTPSETEESTSDDISITEESVSGSTDYVPSDKNLGDNTNDITTTKFSIDRIVDHTINEVVQPRVVFGSGYVSTDNYIKFDSNGNFEMYLSGYNNNVTSGKYTEYYDTIYVEYTDGTAAEYIVEYDSSGTIGYIVVNYGDYDIYFS